MGQAQAFAGQLREVLGAWAVISDPDAMARYCRDYG